MTTITLSRRLTGLVAEAVLAVGVVSCADRSRHESTWLALPEVTLPT
ncbi:hypothetical protein [Enteractinococcus helveticum]|nr:hypothetical protein [Enteractinococcus helveticum]